MNYSILISIKPQFAEKIYSGEKEFEFRKKVPTDKPGRIVFYETAPVGKVTGEAKVDYMFTGKPENIWIVTKTGAGVTEEFYNEYFKDAKEANAMHLTGVKRYSEPKTLRDFGVRATPQSFVYLD